MSGDNGGIESKDENKKEEIIKTPEQLKLERAERFTKDPETFIEISELVCAVLHNPKSQLGISVMVGVSKRSELNTAQCELNHIIDATRRQMDRDAQEATQGKIVPAKHGIFNYARRRN